MRFHAVLGLAACLTAPALAVFADDAYHIDYHHALVGFPKQDATFFQQPYAGSKASLIYTLSDKLVVGAINPKDGAVVWRQLLSSNETRGILKAGEGQDIIISAAGDHIIAWSGSDGRLVWETKFNDATVEDVEILEQEDGNTVRDAKDAVVLLGGSNHGLKRLDGKTGRVKWTYHDNSGDTPFQISTSATSLYYIALHTTILGGSKIRVTSVSPVNGQKIDQYTLSSESEITSPEHILFAGANSASPLLAWTDKAHKVLKVNIIGTKAISSFNIATKGNEEVEKVTLHAPSRINSLAHFLVQYQTATGHYAEVFHVDLKTSSISKAYSLPEVGLKGTFTTTTSDANVYFTRITEDEITVVSSVSHGILGRWPVKSNIALVGAYPVHGISEVVVRSGSAQAVRSAIFYSNGQWALVRNGELAWTRPELLAGATSAVWGELPEEEALAHELEIEGHENAIAAYIHRVKRHIRDLEHLPQWLQALPGRILSSFIGKTEDSSLEEVKHDSFGFHKLVLVATDNGHLVALDAGSSGKLIWNIDLNQLVQGIAFDRPTLKPSPGFVEVVDTDSKKSVFINVSTGGLTPAGDVKAKSVPVTDTALLVSYELVDGELKGFLGQQSSTKPLWTFLPPNGERIVGVTSRPVEDPVASIGKVLGDRRVLYKYLNPNLVLVTAVHEASRTASLYLLDSASGNLLHAISHSSVDISRHIPSTISENWFTYSLTLDSATNGESRGYLLIVAELFESALPDDRGPLGASSNSSSIQPSFASGVTAKPHVLSQTYHIPEEISHMTVTQTRQGITSRELLVTLPESSAIVGIPRHIIDPRRPVGRDPTALEASEGLAKYAPTLLFDPKWYLNHKYELLGIKDVLTTPSLVESTSLVFAYGLDVFGTRVAPSFAFDMLGKGFNKLQMSATVAALFVGVLFVAPLVRRKQINSLWTIP